MSYFQTTFIGANCPKCQRKLTIILNEQQPADSLAVCFRCKQVIDLTGQKIPQIKDKQLAPQQRSELAKFVTALPDQGVYKGPGSQLRLQKDQSYQRHWLSLAAYEKQFGEKLGYNAIDLRPDKSRCKWCGKALPTGRRSFCKDSCSRNYSKATFTKRTTPSLPYRIACRDSFICQATGEDLAQHNRFEQRIPTSNGHLTIHHLVPVAAKGTDHESNLLTLSDGAHLAYHSGDPVIVAKVEAIKAERLAAFGDKMSY